MGLKKWTLLDDILPPDLWLVTKLRLDVTNHLLYKFDLPPSSFLICGTLKKHLAGNQFASDVDVKKAVVFGYRHRFPFNRYTSVGDTSGQMPKWQWTCTWTSDVYNHLLIFHVLIQVTMKFSPSECLLTSFLNVPSISKFKFLRDRKYCLVKMINQLLLLPWFHKIQEHKLCR